MASRILAELTALSQGSRHSIESIYINISTPLREQDATLGQYLSGVNWYEFRVFLLDRLPYQVCLVTDGGRTVGFIPFLRILAICETQTALFRI